MKLTDMPIIGLARLCHRAEDTGDDILLNEVIGEVERRDSLALHTSPVTGIVYRTGEVHEAFHRAYLDQMADRTRAKK